MFWITKENALHSHDGSFASQMWWSLPCGVGASSIWIARKFNRVCRQLQTIIRETERIEAIYFLVYSKLTAKSCIKFNCGQFFSLLEKKTHIKINYDAHFKIFIVPTSRCNFLKTTKPNQRKKQYNRMKNKTDIVLANMEYFIESWNESFADIGYISCFICCHCICNNNNNNNRDRCVSLWAPAESSPKRK